MSETTPEPRKRDDLLNCSTPSTLQSTRPPLFPSDTDIGRVRAIINEFGEVIMSYRNKLYFKITPKVHKLMHVPMYMEVMNPRWLQAYLEEGLIGSVTKIWQRGVKGRYERQIQSNVLLRRYLGLLLRLEL